MERNSEDQSGWWNYIMRDIKKKLGTSRKWTILSKLLPGVDRDSLLGDLLEIYEIKSKEQHPFLAKIWFSYMVLKFIPEIISNSFFWSFPMFCNYFKMAYRSLLKNKVSSFINIFGLSVAIGCSIVSYLFVDFHYNKDTFHKNAENIFLIENILENKDGQQIWGDTPTPLGPILEDDFSQIEMSVRIANSSSTVRVGDNIFEEQVRFVDENFFEMFTFPLKYGDKVNVLTDRNSVVLNQEIAFKYFGDMNPVGKQMEFIFSTKQKESFFVTGVTEKLPKNTSFGFDILIPYSKQLDVGSPNFDNWQDLTQATFILLKNNEDIRKIANNRSKYLELQNAANPDRPMVDFVFEPLLKMAQNSYKVRGDLAFLDIYPGQIIFMLFGGIFLLLLACFNFMNISLASATQRLKEIGIRKVVGSNRRQIIKQFIGENLLLCLISLIIGAALGKYYFVPGFKSLFTVFEFDLNLFGDYRAWAFLITLLFVTGVGAGAYPAFYISSFQPVNIFKDKLKFGSRNRLVASLLAIQFILSIINLANGTIFIQNNEYQKNRDWGYNQEQVIVIPIENESQFNKLKNAARQNPSILHLSGSKDHISISNGRAGIEILDKTYEVAKFDIGVDYIETMGIRLKEGRTFKKEITTDFDVSVIVNETFVEQMEWSEALGQHFRYNNKSYDVIGVVEDFHFRSFMNKIEPTIMLLVDEKQFNFISLASNPGTAVQTSEFLQKTWKDLEPDNVYKGFFQDSIFEEYKQAMLGVAKSSSFSALVSLLITCMGIYGLIALTITKRMKEISIRKILGAGIVHIITLINKGLLSVIITATIIALPLSYYMNKILLDSLWSYHKEIGLLPFVIAVILILFASFFTIFSKIYKTATTNPIETLRNE